MAKFTTRRIKLKKLVTGIIIFILAFCLLSMAGAAITFGILFGRSELDPEGLELRYEDIDSNKYPRQEMKFPSGENMLQAYLYEQTNSNGIVIIVHGINGGADTHLSAAMYLFDRGWSVFCFDGTGCRQSEGKSTVGLSQMKLDLLSAIDFLSKNYPSAPLFLYGHSMGAYASATVLDDCEEISAAVLISGFNQPVETMYYHASSKAGILAAMEYPFLCLYNRLIFGSHANESAADAITSSGTPVMLVHGSMDSVIPVNISIYGNEKLGSSQNIQSIYVETEGRNLHSSPWLSLDSAAYRLQLQEGLEALHEEYGSKLSQDVLDSFLQEIDREMLFTLDEEFMDSLCLFFAQYAK